VRDKDYDLSEAVAVELVVVADGDVHVDVSLNGAIAIVVGLATPCCVEWYEIGEVGDQSHWEAY